MCCLRRAIPCPVQNCGFGKLTPLTPKFLRSGILPEACEVDAVHAVRGSVDTKLRLRPF